MPISRVIYQTWETKELPPDMAHAVQQLKDANPGFVHELFDDTDCREFIRTNFPEEVLYCYDTLRPGAYKADLWRYCILYIHGGIYLDIKYIPVNGFTFESIIHSEQLCKDISKINTLTQRCTPTIINRYIRRQINTTVSEHDNVYNALMIMKPGNPYLAKAIQQIYEHCKNKEYTNDQLSVTGPGLLGKIIPSDYTYRIHHKIKIPTQERCIVLNNSIILIEYPSYRREILSSNKEHYSKVWQNRNIYNS